MVYKYIVTHELHGSKMVKIYYNILCEKCFKIEKKYTIATNFVVKRANQLGTLSSWCPILQRDTKNIQKKKKTTASV